MLDYAVKGPKKFLGGAFVVESYQDLERASALGGGKIEEMTCAPGRGHSVTIQDPEGFPMVLIHGQASVDGQEPPENIVSNYEKQKPRLREFLRFTHGPAAVFKVNNCLKSCQCLIR